MDELRRIAAIPESEWHPTAMLDDCGRVTFITDENGDNVVIIYRYGESLFRLSATLYGSEGVTWLGSFDVWSAGLGIPGECLAGEMPVGD